MVDTLVGLVSHYSPSGQERDAVEWLVAHMKSLGFSESFVDGAGNAVGFMGNGARQIILLGHIDTVPGQIPVRWEGDGPDENLYGRGSVDAKGPLAAFVDAVAQVGAVTGWQFVIIGAVGEERDSEGARFVLEQYRPDFLIVGEPNQWDRLALGYKGSAWANLTVRREQTHTASGEETAAEVAVELWQKVKSHAASFNTDKPKVFDRLLVTLRGLESESNDFGQWARLTLGARLPMEITPENWYRTLSEIAGDASMEPTGFSVPAWKCEKNTQLVRAFLSGIRLEGGEPRFVYKTGTADLNIVAPTWKCPALVYGPGDSALDHTPQEHISLRDYRQSVSVLSAVLRTLSQDKTKDGE